LISWLSTRDVQRKKSLMEGRLAPSKKNEQLPLINNMQSRKKQKPQKK